MKRCITRWSKSLLPIQKLLSREDESMLIRKDNLLVLKLGLDSVHRVAGHDLQSGGLAGQIFDKDLRSVEEKKHEVQDVFLWML